MTAYAISRQLGRNEHQAKVSEESSEGRWRMAANTMPIHKSPMGQVAFKADEELRTGILVRRSGTVSEALLHGEDNLIWYRMLCNAFWQG